MRFTVLTSTAEWCSASSMPGSAEADAGAWPAVLATFDPSVTAFLVPDENGRERRVAAEQHPGLPQMRFAVITTSTLSTGSQYVSCVRGDG